MKEIENLREIYKLMERSDYIHWLEHPELVEFLKNYIPGHSEEEIREAFRDRTGITLTEGQICNFKYKHKVKSGTHGGQFVKGQQAHNKGKKMPPEVYEKAKATMFKPGTIPPNWRPVGSERTDRDGYTMVKIADPNKWILKQRLIYEQLHGVKLKKNEVVIFLDGNRQNFSADNLHKLTRGALARYNQDRLYCEDKNISCAAAMIAELKDKTGELKRNGTQTHTKTQC